MWTQRSRPSTKSSPNMEHTSPPIRRRTTPWLAEQPSNAGKRRFPCRKILTFSPRPRAWPAKTCAPSPTCPSGEVRAILELAHDVKRNPREYRHALDAKQMVMLFEKASLRTRLTFEAGINTMGGNAIFVDQTRSPLGERESIADVARNVERWVDVIVLRTYAHDTITEMAANARVPGDQCALRFRASLPGAGRLHDARRALRLGAGPQLHLCRRRQQRLPLADADRRATGREVHRGHAARLLARYRNRRPRRARSRSRTAARFACCRIRRPPSKAPTRSTPTCAPAWASSTSRPSARPSSGRSR